jgi:tetratricopeptide (TPR) repeat protein
MGRKTHGHPFIGQLAIGALSNCPASEVIEKLHQRDEIRQFVINKLLGRTSLSQTESKFLQLASIFRIPVLGSAFFGVAAAQTTAIIADLVNRFLLASEGDRYQLHPLVCEYFKAQVSSSDEMRKLHHQAHTYYQGLQRVRKLSLDEKVESIYHAFSSGNSINLEDLRLFTGPIRTAMFDALRDRDWPKVHSAADQILRMFSDDAVAKVANAVALDATGEAGKAEQYFDSVRHLDSEYLWVAIEFAKSRIRRRDFQGAWRILEELEQRFGTVRSIQLAWAQLHERLGETDEAVQRCEAVLSDPGCREKDAFLAGLILRYAHRLPALIEHVESKYHGAPTNSGLLRLYGYACVVTNHAPADGLQLLSQLWSSAPGDGYVIADYAAALSLTQRITDARQLFERGLAECKGVKNDRRALLEEYAIFLGRTGNAHKSHEVYRDLLRGWPYALHNHRRFAQSLLGAASAASTTGSRGIEDSCLQEAEQVIRKLLEIAPSDRWAAELLHRIQQRIY